MERIKIEPRPNWSMEIEKVGFDFYHIDGIPYWHESAYYRFTAAEIDMIEAAANTVHKLCLRAIERIVSERLYPLMGIDPDVGKLIAESWEKAEPAIYGRFDFLYDGEGPPKLLEYNADTPTSLFEASIVQWNWREQRFPRADQFNSIHEHLVERWRRLLVGRYDALTTPLYVTTATPMPEDEHTVQYIGSCAEEAGWKMKFLPIQQIGWNGYGFTDLDETVMRYVFKLYPWEWLMRDDFGKNIKPSGSLWLEPMWKMLLSNKGILPILWQMFPEHENLLPAYRDPADLRDAGVRYVRKPALGREGQNVQILEGTRIISQNEGIYDTGPFIYQQFGTGANFDGITPNLGVWMVNDEACGMGIREDDGLIVANGSRFVPHIFE